MMHPPRQMVAMSPSFRSQPNCCGRRRHLLEALRVGDDLRGVERVAHGADRGGVRLSRRRRPRPDLPLQLRAPVALGREGAGVYRLGDGGQGHAEVERRLRGPATGSLLLRLVEDGVDERLAGRVGFPQDGRGDLDQIAVEVALLPVGEDLGDRGRVEAVQALHEVVGFGDQLHVGVFDAVVHHLDVVARALGADVGAARRPVDRGGHLVQDRREPLVGGAVAARHHARPFERADLAARDAHADIADPLRRAGLVPARGVGEERVAAVDRRCRPAPGGARAPRSRRPPACRPAP